MRIACLASLALLVLPAAASAAETAWQELAPGVRARVVADGATRAGIEIALPEGTKTYWRIAGETGLPTTIDLSGSTGLSAPTLDWPMPQIDRTEGFRNYVYHGNVVIPVRYTATPGAVLDVAMTLGICSDICIPAAAAFVLPLDGQPDQAAGLALDLANRSVPISWDQPEPAVARVTVGPDGLDLIAPSARIDPATLIADMGDAALLFGAPQKSRVAGAWTVPVMGEKGASALVGRTLNLTFMTPLGPYAASVVVTPAP